MKKGKYELEFIDGEWKDVWKPFTKEELEEVKYGEYYWNDNRYNYVYHGNDNTHDINLGWI